VLPILILDAEPHTYESYFVTIAFKDQLVHSAARQKKTRIPQRAFPFLALHNMGAGRERDLPELRGQALRGGTLRVPHITTSALPCEPVTSTMFGGD